jgi:hypothetical protein
VLVTVRSIVPVVLFALAWNVIAPRDGEARIRLCPTATQLVGGARHTVRCDLARSGGRYHADVAGRFVETRQNSPWTAQVTRSALPRSARDRAPRCRC